MANREHKKLEKLMLFCEVAQHLSFTKAAAQLGMSSGYLSDQIKRLEVELGTVLLIRSTRKIRLTGDGERVVRDAEQMRRMMRNIERNIHRDQDELSGLLRLTAPKLFADKLLLDICHAFNQQHPAVRFSIDCSYTKHDLIQSHFDLAFRSTGNPPQNMIAKSVLTYRHVCCAAPEYLATYGVPKVPDDLTNHQCLHGPDIDSWHIGDGKVSLNGWLMVNDSNMLKNQAVAERGVIYVAEYLVKEALQSGELVEVLPELSLPSQQIFMLYPQVIHQSARLKAFIQFAQQTLASNKE